MTARSVRDGRRTASISRAWLAACALVVLGLVGGAAFDPRPERPVVRRAGYRVLEADFHMHTTYSDGTLSPLSLVRQAERRGLDAVSVTEHNTVLAGRLARAWSEATGGPIVIPGEEVTTGAYHLIAVGLERTVSPDQPIERVVADIHAQGGVAIGAHPVKRFQPGLAPVRAELDGVELMHPIAFMSRSPEWSWLDLLAYYEETTPRPAAIGSSDYHFASVLGLCRTLVFVREPASADAVVEAIRARRTVVLDRDGRLLGHPELVGALEREPYTPRTSDYAYRGENTADRVLRLLGLAGVAGVAFLRVRPRPRGEAEGDRDPVSPSPS
ncbi:MAG: CehA/McbA family metallohydrolase [Labilithrix sp.]|nr:CehA/McbA family metallohydrolase [Labilithrix sp.]MCW5832848.1 CehA/McbA family metallohydrolase [Labilithrix sp.]